MKRILIFLTIVCLTATVSGQIDRTRKPKEKASPPLTLPKIQHAALGNGLALMLVEHHELPVVQFQLVLKSGSTADPAGKSGLANLTAQMMDEGTGKRTALQIADDLDFIGANVSVNAAEDATFASLLTIKEHLATALEIYGDVLLNPSFPQQEWDRVKKSHLTNLMSRKDQPASVASNVFGILTYGASHPYGQPSGGTEASVNAIALEDLKDFYAGYFKPNNGTLIVVGDVTMKEIRPLVEKYFGTWKKGTIRQSMFPAAPNIASTQIYLVDKPQAAQSEIRIGHVGVARNTPDYFAITVMNTILGGQFSSRINMNLRETKGYTYGARSSFSMQKEAGPFIASSAVKSSVTDSSVIEFMKELARIKDEDVTQQELEFAVNSIVRRQPQGFETPGQIAGQLMNLVLYNLPDTYFNTSIQNIEKVTVKDVRRVSEKYLNPKAMNIVIVGDVATIKDGLEKLGYGAVHAVSADGQMMH
jgi:predicted Zn-dependent peptidase